jgi:glycosyltransferase involved in cell wall biosynthesis
VCPVKNQELMIEAAARARPALDRSGAQVLFVGDGSGLEAHEARIRALGMSDRVRFTGFRESMEPVYRDASLVVLASRNEAIPMSLIEAVAAGRRYLATAVGGVPELHRPEHGRLVPSGDAGALADALSESLAGEPAPPLPDELRREVVQRFHPRRFADAMEEIATGGAS